MIDISKFLSPCLVVSQPMYFPWIGMLQQIRLCDSFFYYDDVQFARGFFNRVQIKTANGIDWITVPLKEWRRGQLINEVRIDNSRNWRRSHRDQLKQAYKNSPFCSDMLDLVDKVFSVNCATISDISCESMSALIEYFTPIGDGKLFLNSSSLNVPGASSERLVDISALMKAKTYLTGHGASNYLDHMAFEKNGISVDYIDYQLDEYPQLHGPFTPYVSALDLIANCGKEGLDYIRGTRLPWRKFIDQRKT
jgi:hypothetical protein